MARAFRLDIDKTIQAVAFLLRREPGHRMNYMRLLKILYIAERESLQQSGSPISGSRVVAMPRGPVMEDVLHLIRGQHPGTPQWARFVRVDNYQIEMTEDPGVGKLSRFVTEKLEEVAARHAQHDEWDMVAITHLLPEWQKNDPGTSSKEIPIVDILDGIGRKGDLAMILERSSSQSQAAEFFADPK